MDGLSCPACGLPLDAADPVMHDCPAPEMTYVLDHDLLGEGA